MANTPNVGLPTMDPNVLQPSIPFNTAMQLLDAVAQIVVVATANTPPTTVAGDVGKVYLIDSAPTGAWTGRAGQLALCTAPSLWAYLTPRVGWYADIGGGLKRLSSSGWVSVGGGSGGDLSVTKLHSSGDVVAEAGSYANQFQARFNKGQGSQPDQTEGWLQQVTDADGNSLGGIYANASGLSLVNNKGGIWNQVQLLNNGQILLNGRSPFPRAHIDGSQMVYAGQSAITVGSGSCYIPGAKTVIEFSDIAKSGLSLSASTWYHLYIYLNGTTPDVEVATTEPSAPYIGRARTKSGDATRRYIGSFRTDTSGAVMKFMHSPAAGAVKYLSDINGNGLKVLDNGTSTSSATVSVAAVVPSTAFVMEGFAENSGSSIIYINSPDMGPASPSSILQFLRTNGLLFGDIALASQQFNYSLNTSSSNGLTVWCVGYKYMR
ncbi:DUF2793 domain-containing protein [Xanthomonas sontii]|uniref:DUF2793 domain-containing protein n=1 Tax=Xanthomonas sontii TaxID=2650745 RepID=A0A6N7Q3F6_9XANT|nr:DUF2793 domain-containing protein [Xanthomonas sontii]MRG98878.1 DUF2793 domain-containing protein [Xanthomonas sontii]MRH73331.1 DUF2793 domain-containing protein [Xanthomonas sontii]